MANLAPYYVHSNYDLFQGGPTSGYSVHRIFGRSKVKNFVALMRQELVENQSRLAALENAFYRQLNIQAEGDAGFNELMARIVKNAEENRYSIDEDKKEIYLFTILRKYVINNISTFITQLTHRLVDNFGKTGVISGEELKKQLAEQLKIYSQTLFSKENKLTIYKAINRFVKNTKVNVKMTNIEGLTSSNQRTKVGARSNIQGDFGEIAYGLAELVLNEAVDGMTVTNTGSLLFKGSSGSKQFTSDLVFELSINGESPRERPYQIGWQIKTFNLSNSSYDSRIKIANFEVTKAGWEELGKKLGNEGLYEDSEQFDALTYALVNAVWFNQGGDYKIGPNKNYSLDQITINSEKGVLATVKQLRQILGILTARNMTKNLSDIVTTEGKVIGTVELAKEGKGQTTVKKMNIPAVFWVINEGNFFPSRWVLRDLVKWVDFNFAQQVFTPTSDVTIKYEGEKLRSPAKFWFEKLEAVGEPLRRPPLYTNAIRNVGNDLGREIVSDLHISANMAIIRNQIKNLSSMLGLK